MFVVTEAEAAAIRAAFEQRGELAAAVGLRRLFPGITDITQARECAWRSLHAWLKRLDIPIGGKSMKDVRDQAERISRCRLTFQISTAGRGGSRPSRMCRQSMILHGSSRRRWWARISD
jgi:hypothetical protein